MAEIKDPRGKHLLGEAVRLLVQSGATGASITDFINEYSGVIEASLAPLPEPVQPDLKAHMKDALKEVHRVTQGVPRDICVLCDALFVNGYVRDQRMMDLPLVERTVNEMAREKKWPVQLLKETRK